MTSWINLAILLSQLIKVGAANNQNSSNSVQFCVKKDDAWCLPKDYDSNIDPFKFKEQSSFPFPWDYTFELMVLEVSGVDDISQRISFLMYFRMDWHDPRLRINLNSTEWKTVNGDLKEFLFIPFTTPIWFPDLDIYGLRAFDRKKIFTDSSNLKLKQNNILSVTVSF